MAELCLGTVQFGMKYGINNTMGQPSRNECFHMLDVAIDRGIGVIDTAEAYGEAEEILGNYFKKRKNANRVKVISKLRPNLLDPEEKNVKQIIVNELEQSLKTLSVERLDGFLLHTPEYIYNDRVIEALRFLKEKKLVSNIGISIYEMKDGFEAINTGVIDYIQLPFSVLDQRALKENFFEQAQNAGITLFTRSAFLQGLFMMEFERIPLKIKDAIPYLKIFNELILKYGIDKISALLHFVKSIKEINYLVFGVDNVGELEENIDKWNKSRIPKQLIADIKSSFQYVDKSIILPSLWSNGKKSV